ncbi:MAG: ATP-binding cassette domain-containing protein [Lachnospiraceae bacterium]|nr:ATP-binding cassette domain-containing protein [Lachnospiraceae bacterium]
MILFDNVFKQYDNYHKPVFAHFSERIEDGEFVLVTGESGSGKSTLIKLLLKEIEPDRGEIFVNGKRLTEIPRAQIPYYRRGIGVVFQDFRLFEEYTVFGNLELVLGLTGARGKDAELKITHILKLLGIDRLHRRFPSELSGGEKQKVCMARALINMPKILLADEPTGNLDPESSAEIIKLLSVANKQGITVIMATHDLETCRRLIEEDHRINLDEINRYSRESTSGGFETRV